MNIFKFTINNGDTQVWEQKEDNGEVKIYKLLSDWEESDDEPIYIPAEDMVMLANLYRDIKRYDIANVFVNCSGKIKMAADNIVEAVAKREAET